MLAPTNISVDNENKILHCYFEDGSVKKFQFEDDNEDGTTWDEVVAQLDSLLVTIN